MSLFGLWHITEMELWDEDYFNMEVQAYIQIDQNGLGHFQFGLVDGQIDGELASHGDQDRFEFTWDGNDEMDPISGSGWLRLIATDTAEGRIKIHLGDSSMLKAFRAHE